MWEFAAACMRTYLILRGEGAALPRRPGRSRRRSRRPRDQLLASRPSTPARRIAALRNEPLRPRCRAPDAGDGARAARPARPRATCSASGALPLVAGVDSSTSRPRSRSATPTTAGSSPAGAPAPGDAAAAVGAGPGGVVGGVRGSTGPRPDRRTWRADRRRRPAARARRPRRRRCRGPAGQALERHRVGRRRGVVDRPARRWRGGVGGGVRLGAGRRVDDHQAVVAAPARARVVGSPGPRRAAARTTGSTAQLTGRLTTDRGDASGTGYWSAGRRRLPVRPPRPGGQRPGLGRRGAGGARPARARRRVGGAVVAPGTGDNMAGALGIGLRPGDVAISLGTSGTVFTVSDRADGGPVRARAGFADATGQVPAAGVHAERHQGDGRRGRLLGVGHAELDELALGAPRRCRRADAAAVPRRRAHPEPPRRDRDADRPPHRRGARAPRPGRRRRSRVRSARRPRGAGCVRPVRTAG